MLRGNWRGQILGSGSDAWKYWAEKRAGNIDDGDWSEIEDGIARSPGHCMTMGTASTMTAVAEALGPDAARRARRSPPPIREPSAHGAESGRRIVEMVWEDLKPRDVLTTRGLRQRGHGDMALGGSTNAIVHLIAMAGRAGVAARLDASTPSRGARRWSATCGPPAST